MTGREARRWLVFAGLAVLVVAAWSSGLHGAFTYDDKVEVIGNRTIRFIHDWRAVLGYNWSRPILVATYAWNYHLGGQEPFGYHLFDLALQVANAGLAMLVVAEMAESLGKARPLLLGALAAALWALHPLASEAVDYVTGRSEQLCATFYLLATWSWLRWLTRGGWHRFAGAWLAFLAAALTKEVAATAPVAMLLADWIVVRRGRLRSVRWPHYLPAALLILGFAAVRWKVYGVLTVPYRIRPLSTQLWTQAEVTWRYLQLVLLPVGQSVLHDHPETGLTLRSGAAAAGLALATAAALRWRARWPMGALGWLFFLLVLSPSSSFVALKETMAEHRAYLAFLGPCWAGAELLVAIRPRPLRAGVAAALVAALSVASARRGDVWASEVSLWSEAARRNPRSAEAWYGLGDALRLAGERDRAARSYRRATSIDPGFLDAWNDLGMVEADLGDDDEAIAAWRQALSRSPTYCKAHNNLGLLHARRQRFEQAATELQTTLAYCPTNAMALYHLGLLYEQKLGRRRRAIAAYQALVSAHPGDPLADKARKRLLDLTW